MRALSPPPVRGGGTMMIVMTLVALLVIALLMIAVFWRSAWWIENGREHGTDSPRRTGAIMRTASGDDQRLV
jgi:hypothetical protein